MRGTYRRFRGILFVCLILALAFSLAPAALAVDALIDVTDGIEDVAAAPVTDGAVYGGVSGDSVVWSLDTGTGVFTVSGTGPMADVYTDDWIPEMPWSPYQSAITEVIVGDGVTSVGRFAFCRCENLTTVSLPAGLTVIGESAFEDCGLLASCPLPDSLVEIGHGAFCSCAPLADAVIPAGVTAIGGYAFFGCESLTDIAIPAGVAEIGEWAFASCTGLTDIAIPYGVVTIGEAAFADCDGLVRVTIPDSVTSIGDRAFFNCRALRSATVPGGVTEIREGTFAWCESLKSVTLPHGLTAIGELAFLFCTGLTDVTIPDGVAAIGESAFDSCAALRSVTLPASVTTIDAWAFSDCGSLRDIYYTGTPQDWAAISIGEQNEPLAAAAVHFGGSPFEDVPATASYYKYVLWAYSNGIVKGTSATTFSPKAPCTRGQFALMLYRLAGKPDVGDLENPFTDVKSSSSFYRAILWAYSNGIIKGTSATTFHPSRSVTRAQIVLMLYRMAGTPDVSGAENPFADVTETDSCYRAVLWAVRVGVTNGTSATTFSPNMACPRYQLVTFLYRFNGIMDFI